MRSIAFSTPNEINRHRPSSTRTARNVRPRGWSSARGFLPHSVRVCSSLYSQVQSLHRIYELLAASRCVPAVGSLTVYIRVSSNSRTKFPAKHFRREIRGKFCAFNILRYFSLRAYTCILISFLPLFRCIFFYISLFVYKFDLHVSLVALARNSHPHPSFPLIHPPHRFSRGTASIIAGTVRPNLTKSSFSPVSDRL